MDPKKKKKSVGCFGGCSCMKKPASKAPVKRYNIYIPLMYPLREPGVEEHVSQSTAKYLKKTFEYSETNPHRLTKVSRRLKRRFDKDLRGRRLGFVKITIHAYMYLLCKLQDDKTDLLAQELLNDPNCILVQLFRHPSVICRILGCSLLTCYLNTEHDADWSAKFEELVAMLCAHAHPKGRGLAPADPDKIEELNVAALQAIRAHMAYAARVAVSCKSLDVMISMVLDNMKAEAAPSSLHAPSDARSASRAADPAAAGASGAPPAKEAGSGKAAKDGDKASVEKAPSAARRSWHRRASSEGTDATVDAAFIAGLDSGAKLSKDGEKLKPSAVAAGVLKEIGKLSADPALAKRVMEGWMRYLDEGPHWATGHVGTASAAILRRAFATQHQQKLLLQGLLRHANARQLHTAERAAVVQFAMTEAGDMADDALHGLALALQYLPGVLPSERRSDSVLESTVMSAMRQFTHAVTEGSAVLQQFGNALEKADTTAVGRQILDCMLAGLDGFPGANAAPTSMSTSARPFATALMSKLLSLLVAGEEPRRLQAHALLRKALPLSDWLREVQVQDSTKVIMHVATAPSLSGSAAVFEELDRLLSSIVVASQPGGLVVCAQLVAQLAEEAVAPWSDDVATTNAGMPRAVHGVAGLMLANSMARHVAKACNVDFAPIACVAPVVDPTDLPALELTESGLRGTVEAGTPLMVGADEESCEQSLKAFRVHAFVGALVTTLCGSGMLLAQFEGDVGKLDAALVSRFDRGVLPVGDSLAAPNSGAYSTELTADEGAVAVLRDYLSKNSFSRNDYAAGLATVHDVLAYASSCKREAELRAALAAGVEAPPGEASTAGLSGAQLVPVDLDGDASANDPENALGSPDRLRWAAADPLKHALALVDDIVGDGGRGAGQGAGPRQATPPPVGLDGVLMHTTA